MQVITLGTGSPLPDPNRAGPATLIRVGGRSLLFDCGRGVLMRAAGVGLLPAFIDRVLLTHLHSDHITDFNDIVTMRWAMSAEPNPLRVIGPEGTQGFVDRTVAMLSDDIGWRMEHHGDLNWRPDIQVTEAGAGTVVDEDGLRITAAFTEHAPVRPTLGYRVEAEGGSVVIAGDTRPCAALEELCAGADVYVQTVIRPELVRAIPAARLQDILDYHSSIEDAARAAKAAGVRTLVLTHPVPPPAPGTEQDWVDDAKAHFDGEVHLANDLFTLDV
jgi:ribonuclease Z